MVQVKLLCIIGASGCTKTTVMRVLQMNTIGLGLAQAVQPQSSYNNYTSSCVPAAASLQLNQPKLQL